MTSRQNSNLSFEIRPTDEDPLILEVSSEKAENANIIAYFLARETKGEILNDSNEIISLSSLIEKMGDFNLQERLSLADKSIWRKTTEANPYPNLNNN